MDTQLKQRLIAEAQEHLRNHPQDPMHDVTHHERVLKLAKELIDSENLVEKVDMDVVEIICWWHDVQLEGTVNTESERLVQATARYLISQLPEELRDRVFDSMVNHESGSAPNYIEGKILQDADKLEILSEPRIDSAVEGVRTGKLEKERLLRTLAGIKSNWLPVMPSKYSFEFSKKRHAEKLVGIIAYLDQAIETVHQLNRGEPTIR